MIRRPTRSTQSRSSAASEVYKRQAKTDGALCNSVSWKNEEEFATCGAKHIKFWNVGRTMQGKNGSLGNQPFSAMLCSTFADSQFCLLYTSPSPRDVEESRMPSSA
eukprot:TRINITY_DN5307_c0_g1_i1.p2 TRINITY_DN5307_c0_g1~~TRINITY_DN5307_c0_g1_i1.p2  ORF type:complete len:106 (+),score=80.07 TRINITY_DN5307_c0_g1_i1:1-318(+)